MAKRPETLANWLLAKRPQFLNLNFLDIVRINSVLVIPESERVNESHPHATQLSNNMFLVYFLVHFHERYSDLEKSIYLPSPSNGGFSEESKEYEDSYDVKVTGEFVRLHPCAQLVAKQVNSQI